VPNAAAGPCHGTLQREFLPVTPVVLDASVMVALFDDADRHHLACVSRISRLLPGTELLTTWPCVTEASYLLAPQNHFALLGWLHAGGARVLSPAHDELATWISWIQQYSEPGKTLMDLADASLIWLAVHADTRKILTLDQRNFSRYRLPDGRALEVLA
jgi:uncharacterized protein